MLTAFVREADRLVPVEVAATADPVMAARLLWIDIVDPQPADAAFALDLLGIEIPSLHEMEEIELSARLYEEDDAVFMTAPLVVRLDGDAPRLTPLTFILGRSCLVTVRHAEVAPFDEVRGRRLRANGGTTAEVLMCDLLDAIINRIADVLERGASRCDTMSHEVFARKSAGGQELAARDLEAILHRIGRQGDMLGKLRESLVGLARLLSYHDARSPREKREVRVRLKTMQRDVQALTDYGTFLSGKVNFLLDATLGLINLEQNQIVKIFTVAAVAFLPPTLIASIYGMNFDHMPELQWRYGYALAVGLMIVSAILPFAYFRRRGWL